jgi:hypothetical protein
MGAALLGRSDNYLYKLQASPDAYYTAVRPNGDQLLIVTRYPDVFALTFDTHGRFCDVNKNSLSRESIRLLSMRGRPKEFVDQVEADIKEWLERTGFEETPIVFQRFWLDTALSEKTLNLGSLGDLGSAPKFGARCALQNARKQALIDNALREKTKSSKPMPIP